jgi:hypothetical protein
MPVVEVKRIKSMGTSCKKDYDFTNARERERESMIFYGVNGEKDPCS